MERDFLAERACAKVLGDKRLCYTFQQLEETGIVEEL